MAYPDDTLGRVVRFLCGMLLGLLMATWLWLGEDWPGWAIASWFVGLPVLFGFLSARFGDPFWEWFLGGLRHWFGRLG